MGETSPSDSKRGRKSTDWEEYLVQRTGLISMPLRHFVFVSADFFLFPLTLDTLGLEVFVRDSLG